MPKYQPATDYGLSLPAVKEEPAEKKKKKFTKDIKGVVHIVRASTFLLFVLLVGILLFLLVCAFETCSNNVIPI